MSTASCPDRRHLAAMLRRHWPVVAVDAMSDWAMRRLHQWKAEGRRDVRLEVDLATLTDPVRCAVEAQVEALGMQLGPDAAQRLALTPDPARRADSPFYCPSYWRDSTEPFSARVARFGRRLQLRSRTGPVVLFVGLKHHNTPSINYLASALRSQGVDVHAIFLHEPPPDDIYTDAIHVGGSLGLLSQLLRTLPPLPVYVQAHARWAFLGLFLKRLNPSLRVCQEIYDWTGLFVPDDRARCFAHNGVYSEADILLSKWAELAAIRLLDGVFYKNGGPAIEALLGPSVDRATHLWPAPPRDWIRPNRRLPRPPRDGWRLVYAGQIKGGDNAPTIFGDMYYLPLARDLTAQRIEVDVYWPVCDAEGGIKAEFVEYAHESEGNPRFGLYDGQPPQRLIETLHGSYDFGLLLYYFEPDLAIGRAHLQSALASKLFTYLAAGLPVIVSAEFTYMASLVRDWGIGLVVKRSEVSGLARLLDAADMDRLREQVGAAQRRYFMEANVPAVISALFPSDTNESTRSASRW